MKTVVETVAAPYTSAKYLIYIEACNFDHKLDSWTDEVTCEEWEKSFDSLNDALHYLDTFTTKDAERIAREHNRSCLHVSIDKGFYIGDEFQESVSYVAGVHWINGLRTMYIESEAYMSKPW